MTITLELTEERERELREVASKRGQDPEAFVLSLVDDAILVRDDESAGWADPEERAEALAGVRRGLADFAAGRHRPMEQVFADIKERHGIPD